MPIPSVSCMRVYQSYTQGVGVQIKGGIIVTLANPITGVLLVYTSSYYSKATPSVHIVLIIMRQLALALESPFLSHCWLLTLSVHAQQGLLYLFVCLSPRVWHYMLCGGHSAILAATVLYEDMNLTWSFS